MKFIKIVITLIASVTLFSCEKAKEAGDTSFARSTFVSLLKGDNEVQSKIDWATLNAGGINAGAAYSILDDPQKQDFRNSFVTQFSSAFRNDGRSVEEFTNWRVTFHDDTRTEVAADSPRGVLAITVSERDSVKRISSITLPK